MEHWTFIKKGAKVRRTWRDYNYYAAICKGYGPIPYEEKEEIVTILGRPRDYETKQFVSMDSLTFYPDENEILIQNEKGHKFYVMMDELSIYAELSDLSFEDFKSLYEQISIGSIYLADYENTFGIDKNEVCALADGYLEYLYNAFGKESEKYDTPEEFAYYAAA